MGAQQIIGYILIVVDMMVAISIIISVLLQGGKIRGIGGAITGTSDSALFEHEKRSTSEHFSTKITWRLGSFYLIYTFVVLVLANGGVIFFG